MREMDGAFFLKSRSLIRSPYLLTRGHTEVFFSLANYRQISTLKKNLAINRKGKRVGWKGGGFNKTPLEIAQRQKVRATSPTKA